MSTNTSHTPGPWEMRRLIDKDGIPYATLYEAHIDIGPCMIWAPVGNEEQEANARLIAAAPDLLEACKLLLMCSLANDVSGREMIRKARLAVEKATGRDSGIKS